MKRPRYGAIVLAAGMSSRMVENKLLLPWTDGEPIIRRVVEAYLAADLKALAVVTGRDADAVADCLSDLPIQLAHNPDFAAGEMLSSVKVGLRALPADLAGAFIQPGDMPCISAEIVRRLAAAHEAGWDAAPIFRGRRGHPVLLDRGSWRRMLGLTGCAKPRDGLRRDRLKLVEVEDAGVALDVDTREAYERALRLGC